MPNNAQLLTRIFAVLVSERFMITLSARTLRYTTFIGNEITVAATTPIIPSFFTSTTDKIILEHASINDITLTGFAYHATPLKLPEIYLLHDNICITQNIKGNSA